MHLRGSNLMKRGVTYEKLSPPIINGEKHGMTSNITIDRSSSVAYSILHKMIT